MRTALVADDDPDLREFVSVVLQGHGWTTCTVARGDDALAAIETRMPRLLVLDVDMPGLTGLEICRSVQQRTDCVVVLMSGGGSAEDIAAGYTAGAADYLVKPFRAAELLRSVELLTGDGS